MPNRIWRIRIVRRKLRVLRRRLRLLRRVRILQRARPARNELCFNFARANALKLFVERIRFRYIAALRASTQMRLIVRAWRQQVTQSVERALRLIVRAWRQQVTQSVECALRRLERHRELADRAYDGYVEALRHLQECLRLA